MLHQIFYDTGLSSAHAYQSVHLLSSCSGVSLSSYCWWSGIVVSALALINEVNQHRARLVLRWVTDGPCPGSFPGAGHLFRYVTNQPPKANSAVHPSGVDWEGKGRYGSFR